MKRVLICDAFDSFYVNIYNDPEIMWCDGENELVKAIRSKNKNWLSAVVDAENTYDMQYLVFIFDEYDQIEMEFVKKIFDEVMSDKIITILFNNRLALSDMDTLVEQIKSKRFIITKFFPEKNSFELTPTLRYVGN